MGRRSKRRPRTKAASQVIHSLRRIDERHRVAVPRMAISIMGETIRQQHQDRFKGKAVFFDRQSNRVTRWHVWYEGKWFPVVYDTKRKGIATILPDGALGEVPSKASP